MGGRFQRDELADYLVAEGYSIPRSTSYCRRSRCLRDTQQNHWKTLLLLNFDSSTHSVIADDVYPIPSLESTLAKRQALGGVCAEQIAHALQQAEVHWLRAHSDCVFKR